MTANANSNNNPQFPDAMTPRTDELRKILWKRARSNRKDDWIDKSDLPDLSKPLPGKSELEPVIIRRARGIAAMLKAMSHPETAKRSNSYTIFPGELLVGVPPMGSNGLGKIFPDYLDENERHMASIANRSESSVVGHNVLDYKRLVEKGIIWVLETCENKIQDIKSRPPKSGDQDKLDFYEAVTICCQAVVDYANRFADLAAKEATTAPTQARRAELEEIARICRKVPMEPADTMQEALQSILFVHIGMRAGMDQMSFGSLDHTLQPCLERGMKEGVEDRKKAVELVECFIIKAAWPLNLSVENLIEQDHIDYGISMGTHRWYTDQRGNVNQFLQNVVVGGKNVDGTDATVDCTHAIIQAWANVNLTTPGLYVRLHKGSPKPLIDRVVSSLVRTESIPALLNDDVVVQGLVDSMLEDQTVGKKEAEELAYDYCVDGCWEPILNGQGDWTFNMINGMTVLECALNEGATLGADPMLLRGGKRAYRTRPVRSYDDLKEALRENMDFFVFQSAVAMYNYYLLDEFVTPAPLHSAFLGTCLDRGRDESWGGTRYIILGTVLTGLPNMVNSIAAIRKWVFDKKKYEMEDVLDAFRNNYTAPANDPTRQQLFDDICADFFNDSPKFGNNDPVTNDVAKLIADCFAKEVAESKKFSDCVYRTNPADEAEAKQAQRLRMAAGYYGPTLEDHLERQEITIAFTAGLGSFATYALMGHGTAASADRRKDEPLAMNNTPTPGTANKGLGHILASVGSIGLSRFSAGAPVDLCLEVANETDDDKRNLVESVIRGFLDNDCHTLSLTLGNTDKYTKIYNLAKRAEEQHDSDAATELLEYGNVIVRAGGWQTPFITMSLAQQAHYTRAPSAPRQSR